MIPIETERLVVRNFTVDDWEALHEMIVQYEASEYAAYDQQWPTSAEEVKGIAEWFARGPVLRSIPERAHSSRAAIASLTVATIAVGTIARRNHDCEMIRKHGQWRRTKPGRARRLPVRSCRCLAELNALRLSPYRTRFRNPRGFCVTRCFSQLRSASKFLLCWRNSTTASIGPPVFSNRGQGTG